MRLLPYVAHCRRLLLTACGLLAFAASPLAAGAEEMAAYGLAPTLLSAGGANPSPDGAPVIINVTKQVYRLVVQTGDAVKGGTAFLVSGSRILATNNHVVDKGQAYALGYINPQGQIRWVKLQLLASFPQKDLALLQAVENLPGTALPLASEFPEIASDLYAIGFPAAADLAGDIGSSQATDRNFVLPSVLKGTISRVMAGAWLTNQLQHQTPISPGYSGGPLVDNRGIVVGVSTAINKEANGISYGVAAPDLARFLAACSLPPNTVHLSRFTPMDAPPVATGTGVAERQLAPEERALLQRGYQMLSRGDIAGARTTFEYATQKNGSAESYQALAKTYDPAVLGSLRVIGSMGDAKKAQELYQMAQKVEGKLTTSSTTTTPGARIASAGPAPAKTSCNNSLCMMLEGSDGQPVVMCNKTNN